MTIYTLKVTLAGIRPPIIATFHAACVRILRERAVQAGLEPSFVIYDEDDRESLVKEALRELDFDERTLTPSAVVHRISHCKNQMLGPEDVEQLARTPREERIASLYRLYEDKLQAAGALDFDDLLLRVVRLLETVPEALRWYRNVWTHVLVDEYQDTNRAQYRIVQLLTEEHRIYPQAVRWFLEGRLELVNGHVRVHGECRYPGPVSSPAAR